MDENKKKGLMVYALGAVVVVLVLGAAIAHVVLTHGSDPTGAPASAK